METAIVVAIIGGAVTVLGFVVSGVFGLLANTSQRETAAAAGVEKAMQERLTFKDEQIADCKEERDEARRERDELRREVTALRDENRRLREGHSDDPR